MKATIYNINLNPNSSVKAFANLDLGNGFVVHGLKIISTNKGMFVSPPSRLSIDQNGEKRYRDIFHPITKEARAEMNDTVISAYKTALEQALHVGQEVMNEPYAEESKVQELEEPEPEYSMSVAAF